MKNFMKKIIITMLAFVLLLGQTTFAATAVRTGSANVSHSSSTSFGTSFSKVVMSGTSLGNADVDTAIGCKVLSFTTNLGVISPGEFAKLSWITSHDCTSVKILGVGSFSNSGSQLVSPTVSTEYVLMARAPDDTGDSKVVNILVAINENETTGTITPASSACDISAGNSTCNVNISWNTITSNLTLSFLLKDGNTVGIANSGSQAFPINYNGNTFKLKNNNVELASAFIDAHCVSGTTWNGDICKTDISHSHGSGSGSGSFGTQTQQTSGGFCGITSIASNVKKTTATLNGIVSVSNTNTYFEYGTTQNFGLKTISRNVSANTSFSENISGLNPDTTYFFRLVSNCQNGNALGGINRIHTSPDVVKPAVSPKEEITSVVADVNLATELKIENAVEFIGKNDAVNYKITYKNIEKDILKNPVLQVVVPEGVEITNTSEGNYSNDTHILTVFLKDLAKNEGGEIYLDARLDSIPSGTEKVVSTAMLVYTNTNGVQESATAYVSNTLKKDDGNNLFATAAALFGGLLPVTITGWFVLALMVLVGILITRKYIARKNTNVVSDIIS